MNRISLALASALLLTPNFAMAHDGRRLEIMIVDGQLVTRGYNSAGVDDGAGVERPYYNALHDHWHNNPSSIVAANATLPGFDVLNPGPLAGQDITLTLIGASKWDNPPLMPTDDVAPTLESISAAEEIFVTRDGQFVSTESPGSLSLVSTIPMGGALDLDLSYDIELEPSDVIYVLEFVLSTTAPEIDDSDTVYVLLSPDGATPIETLHHASLFLEAFLGTPICAPDLNGDLIVNGADLATLLGNWGGAGSADLNGDSVINGADLAILLATWGECGQS